MDRTEDIELMRLRVKLIDADRMAAIIDDMVRGRHLDARSKLSDARLDYGQPFNPEYMREGAEMLASTALNADYWLKAGRDTDDRDEAVLAVEQSSNAWRNAAYALAEKLSRTPRQEAGTLKDRLTPEQIEIVRQHLREVYKPDAIDKLRMVDCLCNMALQSSRPEVVANKAMPSLEEVERTMKDAARYRWLRDMSVPPHNFYLAVPEEFKHDRYTPQQVDAAIDAARSPLATKKDG